MKQSETGKEFLTLETAAQMIGCTEYWLFVRCLIGTIASEYSPATGIYWLERAAVERARAQWAEVRHGAELRTRG